MKWILDVANLSFGPGLEICLVNICFVLVWFFVIVVFDT